VNERGFFKQNKQTKIVNLYCRFTNEQSVCVFFFKSMIMKLFLTILKHTNVFTLLQMNINNFNFAHFVVHYNKCESSISLFAYEILFYFLKFS
jgi:hypothetical protein